MSLGIAYFGYRSGFPFRMAAGTAVDVGVETDHPLGFTILQLEELFWRAQELQLEAAFETTETIGSDDLVVTVDTSTYPPPVFSHLKAAATPVTAEHELITPLADDSNTAIFTDEQYPADVVDYDDWTTGTAQFGATSGTAYGWYKLEIDFADTLIYDGLYYPKIIFNMYCPTTILIAGVPLSHNASSQWPVAGSGQSITLNICGATVEIGLGNEISSPGPDSNVFGSGTITISPSTWWGYGGKFDASTGARL